MNCKRCWCKVASAFLLSFLLVLSMISYAAAAEIKGSSSQETTVLRQAKPSHDNPAFTKGFNDGFNDGQSQCNKGNTSPIKTPQDNGKKYMKGYNKGFNKGFNSCSSAKTLPVTPPILSGYDQGFNAGVIDGMTLCKEHRAYSTTGQTNTMLGKFDWGYADGVAHGWHEAGC